MIRSITLSDGTLIHYDGETATVNGKKAKIHPINGGLFVRVKGNNIRIK